MSESIDELKAKAEKGLTPYQIELGHNYLTGFDYGGNEFPQDFAEARHWLERAHEQGAFTATVLLGTMYEEGKGVPVDMAKAISLYEQAAKRDAYLPCVYLARIYANGKGIEQSQKSATEWYRKALSFKDELDDQSEINEALEYIEKYS